MARSSLRAPVGMLALALALAALALLAPAIPRAHADPGSDAGAADSAVAVAPPAETPAPVASDPPGAGSDAAPLASPPPPVAPLPLQPPEVVTAPASLSDISAWLDYKTRGHLLALPTEARIFYRRALLLHASGAKAEAERLVRGAARLDPGFIAPRLTLAGWMATRDQGEAMELLQQAWEFACGSFLLQLVLTANAVYLGIQSLLLALLAAGIIVVFVNQDRLRHGWIERLVHFVTPETARLWSWVFLVAPYLAGLGPALPTIVFLGMLWPTAKLRERSLFVLLAGALAGVPLLTAALDRVSSPLHEERGPFYGVPQVQTQPDSPELRADIEQRAAEHPDNAFLAFAAGWVAQRAGDAGSAEAHYRAVLRLRPNDARALNNLGNALASQGRGTDALDCYQRSEQLDPHSAAPHFNASQIHTLNYDFHSANEELATASALDFELVKTYQGERAEAKWAALVDQWIAPADFWGAIGRAPFSTTAAGALPPLWRTRIECSGWVFSIVAFLFAIGSLVVGLVMHRSIPVRGCGNCGSPVCRRCAERRRSMALCATCAAIESRAESPEFGRVLLGQHRRRIQQRRSMAFRVLGVLIPGVGYLPYRKVLRPVVLFGCGAALVSLSVGIAAPFSYEPRFAVPGHDVPFLALAGAWIAFYGLSAPLYLAFERGARERARTLGATSRSRGGPPARRERAAA